MNKRALALRNAIEMSSPDESNFVDPSKVVSRLVKDESFKKGVVKEYGRMYTMTSKYDLNVINEIIKVFKRKLESEGKSLDVVIFDFFGLLTGGNKIDKQDELAQMLKMSAVTQDYISVPLLQTNKNTDTTDEGTLNDISGHGAIKQALDYAFMMHKNPDMEERLVFSSMKERHTRKSKCDLVQDGMRIHSEEHIPIDEGAIARMAGNRGLRGNR